MLLILSEKIKLLGSSKDGLSSNSQPNELHNLHARTHNTTLFYDMMRKSYDKLFAFVHNFNLFDSCAY